MARSNFVLKKGLLTNVSKLKTYPITTMQTDRLAMKKAEEIEKFTLQDYSFLVIGEQLDDICTI